ncbi:MAG: AraC family transcriptional regulator [Bacteroidota bacterium]
MNALAGTSGDLEAQLLDLPPGVHNAGRIGDGAWVMVGRALPKRFVWNSVPPADSLSILWGKGACTVQDASRTVSLAPDSALWIPKGCAHRGDGSAQSDFMTLFWGTPLDLDDEQEQPRQGGIRSVPCGPVVRQALLSVAVLLLHNAPEAEITDGLEMVRGLMSQFVSSSSEPSDLSLAEVALLERFDEPLPISAFSTLAQQSPPEFSRFFRRAWGLAPTQFRKQLRLLHGTHALVEGHSVTRAALDAGFADTAHFTRTFREQYGEAPSAWARAVRVGGED